MVGPLRSSWAVRLVRLSSSSSSSAGGSPPFLLPLPPFPAFLEGWLPLPAAWAPGVGCATFLLLLLLFQAEMRLVGAVLGLEMEDTRAGKSSSWKVLLPLGGAGYARGSPTGPRAAAAEQDEEAEVQRLGKSSSLSFEVGGGRVLSPGRGEGQRPARPWTAPYPPSIGALHPRPSSCPHLPLQCGRCGRAGGWEGLLTYRTICRGFLGAYKSPKDPTSGPTNIKAPSGVTKEPPRWSPGLDRAACWQGQLT